MAFDGARGVCLGRGVEYCPVYGRCYIFSHLVFAAEATHILEEEFKRTMLECLEGRRGNACVTSGKEAFEAVKYFRSFDYLYRPLFGGICACTYGAYTHVAMWMKVAQLGYESRRITRAGRGVSRVVYKCYMACSCDEAIEVIGCVVFVAVDGWKSVAGTQIVRNHGLYAAALRKYAVIH